MNSNSELLKFFYEEMLMIREAEQALLDLYALGKIRGTVHTCLGQEATASALIKALDPKRDIVCSNHRGHGHYLSFTKDYKGLISEIMGLKSGICSGIGGSQHLHAKNFYSNGILGGMPPVASGMAFAQKLLGNDSVVTVFFGDGAMGEGNIYETLNLAAVFNLPILFAVEQNQYAQSTPTEMQHGGILHERSKNFGVPVSVINGNSVEEVYDKSTTIVNEIRRTRSPQMLFMNTYRLGPHSKGDDNRSSSEIESHKLLCPISNLEKKLPTEWTDKKKSNVKLEMKKILSSIERLSNA